MTVDLVGQQVDHYRVMELLGEGGMGAVYRAYDVNLKRTVAFKVMHRHLSKQKLFRERFLQEAQSAANLEHPSIIAVHHFDFHPQSNLLYMIMAYIPGGSLGDHLQALSQAGQVLPLRELLLLSAQVAEALDYAHIKGVVHRDIKPDNVLIKKLDAPESPGGLPLRAVVTDFGLAKVLQGGLQTSVGTFMGSLPYMSPEQTLGRELDGRSDIYSLGIVLYQLATGRLPFMPSTDTEARQQHNEQPLPPPTTFYPDFPRALETTILRATAKKAGERYPKARLLAEELRRQVATLADDKTAIALPTQQVVSLMTRPQSQEPPPPSRLGENLPPLPNEAQLIVTRQGQPPQAYPLTRSPLLIGRSAEANIVLDDPNVSRRHAQLERAGAGWQVVDLNSSNGTFLETSKLLPNAPEPWAPGRTLRLGPYHLRWQEGSEAPVVTRQNQSGLTARPSLLRPGSARLTSTSGMLVVDMPSAPISVIPGQQAVAQVDLLNQDRIVGHYRLAASGLPPQWVTINPALVELFPGDQATIAIAIHPPRNNQATAGAHNFRLVITSEPDSQVVAAASGRILMEPFSSFATDLSPSILPSGEDARLQVRNDGNGPATYTISGRDSAAAITFQLPPAPLAVAAGAAGTVPVIMAAKRRPWLGREKQLPFELRVQTADGQSQTQAGQLQVRPILPPWVVPLLGILLMVACGLLAFILNWRGEAEVAGVTATAQFIAVQQTATAVIVAGQVAADGTSTAIALTAIPLGDADEDGLTNQREQELKLDPDDPDSDNDGLSDGEEVTRYNTEPAVADTDGDGLGDKAEIDLKSLPRITDTDGDEIPDGVDPDPLHAPPTGTPPAPPTGTPPAPPTDTPPAPPTDTPPAPPTDTPPAPPTATAVNNQALLLDGVDDFATIVNRGDFNFSSTFTVEAWVKPLASTVSGRQFTGIIKGATDAVTSSGGGWVLTYNGPIPFDGSGDTMLAASVCVPDCNAAANRADPVAGQWQHVAATYDGAIIVTYVNGTPIDAQAKSGDVSDSPFVLLGIWTHSFPGLIDEVRIWNTSRTAEQIAGGREFSLKGDEPGLVGYWTFNEADGQQILDSSTRGNHGVLGASESSESSDPARAPSDLPLKVILITIPDGLRPLLTPDLLAPPDD